MDVHRPQIQAHTGNMEIGNYIILTDQQLVMLARNGDATAFETLFNRYRDGVHKQYLNRTGGNVDDSNDLLQETFIKVFLNLDRYDTSFTFGQWIYTIARNTFIDFMRKQRDKLPIGTASDNNGSVINPASREATPEERVINTQSGTQLENHLARMSPRYRRLIELRFFREYSYEEIAAELNIPLGTVKTQIHRARTQLCKLITDSGLL